MSITRARELRTNQSPAERRFWRIVWSFRQGGIHFRRQVQIGPFYADFACHSAKLVVELDGDSHDSETAQHYDQRRTAYLQSRGYAVLRFTNNDVLSYPEAVYTALLDFLHSRGITPTPAPPRKGEGRRRRKTPSKTSPEH